MGWLFPYECQTKSSIIEHVTRRESWNREGFGWVARHTLAKCIKGNVLYAVQEVYSVPEMGKVGETLQRVLMVYLLSKKRNGPWGYKDIDESMGPYEYDCPVSYFDLVGPPPNETATEWREKCRQRANERKRVVKANDVWTLRGARDVKYVVIESAKPLLGSGYKIPRKMLGDRVEREWLTETVLGLLDGPGPVLADALQEAGCEAERFLEAVRTGEEWTTRALAAAKRSRLAMTYA